MPANSSPPSVDHRVSPAVDPETFRAVEGYDDETRGFVDDVVSAFNDAYVTLGKIHDARELWERNPTTTDAQRILIVSKEAAKHKDRITRRLDRAHDSLKARIEFVENELSRPLTEMAGRGSLNAEVRTYAKGLSRSEREKLLQSSLIAGDDPTLAAILGAQPFLSGLTDVDHAHFLNKYHTQKNPHLVRRRSVMVRVLALIYRSGPVLHKEFVRAVGAKPQDVNAIDLANERALAALRIEPTA